MKFEELETYTPKTVPHNFRDLTGTETPYFYIISRAPNGNHGARWNCQCKACGEYCVKDASNISRHKSCGCARKANIGKALRKDLSNLRFGQLTAIEPTGESNSSGNAIWLCKCDCGNICAVDSNNLTSLHTTSCGCINYSIGAKTISEILKSNNIAHVSEFAIPGEYESYPYRFDFAIIDKQCNPIRLVEYDGIQHYVNTWGAWKTDSSLQQRQQRDQIKNEYALSHNIPLVRIPYWERNNITLDMIMGDQYLVK